MVGMVKYTVRLKPRAEKELLQLTRQQRQGIVAALEELENGLAGDVKRLTNFTPEYRLRVGDHRVLFEIERDSVVVYRVCHRREAYR